MIERNQEIYKAVEETLQQSNEKYKTLADKKKRKQEFFVGELIMVHISKERFPLGSYSKLKARNYGPFKILKKINENAYMTDLPKSFNISNSFNIFLQTDLQQLKPCDIAHLFHADSNCPIALSSYHFSFLFSLNSNALFYFLPI